MSKKCPRCGNTDCTIPEVEHHGERWLHCLICGRTSRESRFNDVTVFDRITSSPEVLAPTMIWEDYDWCVFRSNIIEGGEFDTREDAIAATVAKLKEVCDE